ncbi:MAG: hypothetical protein A3D92_16475 [Bacteroidetes bacterium RIFCSPHIGHO2_02_FULL_44_7]|nr:MAG: hypothetical protein A3D92_16475 [Bacteroidetes bacterium RIFCSPHIGHO2_02_FULL_44_7]
MKSMDILIVDDEHLVRQGLVEFLGLCGMDTSAIRQATGIKEGLRLIDEQTPELLFLDVEMGDGTGFDLLNQLKHKNFLVIMITAHNKYAVDAFKFCALDFLEKPIDLEDLNRVLERVESEQKTRDLAQQFSYLKEHIENHSSVDKKIVLKDNKGLYFIKTSEILHCEASGSYTYFKLSDGRSIVVTKPLREYENLLEPLGFVRTHNSHLVNAKHIIRLDKTEGGSVILENGDAIPISQRRMDFVIQILSQQ